MSENTSEVRRRVQDVLEVAAHELRTPISTLKWSLDYIEKLCECEKTTRHVNSAKKALHRLILLTDSLMDTSYMASGKIRYHMESVNVCDIIADLAISLDHGACEIKLDLIDKEILVIGDVVRLEQVVSNLITNACKYAPGRPVEISARRDGRGNVDIEVRDHGMGISPDKLEKIFEKFERDIRPDQNIHGLGLGLWICRQIIEAHGGTICARNIVGNGASFLVKLPLAK